MGIVFARCEPISRRQGGNLVRSAAYAAMSSLEDQRTGKVFDQFKAHGVLEHTEVILPDDTANKWQDAGVLFPALEMAEKRWDAHLGYEIVVALPADKDITRSDRIDMAVGFVRAHITSKGIPAQVSVHRPHNSNNDNDRENYHAHIIVGLRRIEEDDLAKKKERNLFVRHVNVCGHIVVAQAMPWPELWKEFQENYFRTHEKEAIVDPVAIHPNEHIGPLRFRHPRDPRIETAGKIKERNTEAARDPVRVFEHLRRTQQKFDERALNRFLEKHLPKAEQAQVKDAVIKRQQQATAARLQAALERAERIRGKHRIELVRSETHLDARRQQMGVVRKVLHSSGVRADLEIEKWEKWKACSERGIERWSIKIKTFSDQLESVQQQITTSNRGERVMQSQNSNNASNQRQQQAAAALAREQAELSQRQSPEAVAQQLKQLAAERQQIEHDISAEKQHDLGHER